MSATFVIPVGWDSADGVTLLPAQPYQSGGTPLIVGTPLPTAQVEIFGGYNDGTFLEEQPGSPRIERAEQCTCEHTIELAKSDAITLFANLPRGTIVSDTGANIWRVLSCDYTRTNDLHCSLHYVMESLSFDTPPDDFEINDVSLDLFIIKHPRYWRWLCPYSGDTTAIQLGDSAQSSIAQIKEALIRIVQNYIESPFYPSQNLTQNYLQSNIIDGLNNGTFQIPVKNPIFQPGSTNVQPVTWDGNAASIPSRGNPNCPYYLVPVTKAWLDDDPDIGPIHMAMAAAQELITKLWRQEDTPYIPAYEIVWTQRFFQPVYLNPGAYPEDPRDVVPSYFMGAPQSDFSNIGSIPRGQQGEVGPIDQYFNGDSVAAAGSENDSILDQLVAINPQLFSSDGTASGNLVISSLRTSDSYHYERTWFATVHKWKVACVGKWDKDLYLEYGASAPQSVSDFNNNPVDSSGI
jgi:hypothetical protein